MEVVDRLTVRTVGPDPRSRALIADAHALGVVSVERIDVADLYFVSGSLDASHRRALGGVIVDPLLQTGEWSVAGAVAETVGGSIVIEAALLPGVTDAAADQVLHAAAALEVPARQAATGRRYEIFGAVDERSSDLLATRLLANTVIERIAHGTIEPQFSEATPVPPVELVEIRGLDDVDLAALNVERGMALDPAELREIARWFTEAGRAPTDVELETLAQTWSEHCAHKTFRAAITLTDEATGAVSEIVPLMRQLRDTTETMAAPFVRSAFVGNAGILSYVEGITIAVKAETHNHPSAIEPFGGSNTGVGGVIRDVMGAGHHPIATTDILCFGPIDLPAADLPSGVLHPRRIEQGVVAGVADYGNKIGLPTVAGAVLYDPGFTANPLVFCGCIGTAAEAAPLTGPHPGDLVVVLGGRTGRDGLRGATFSSATMDATTGDVAGASVQIGDPITEKLLIDLLADGLGRYTAITDCGAGGLSSAIGEMAEHVGADVDLVHAPLKYPGLGPWEIWLSEAQERMVIAIDPTERSAWQAMSDRRGVEMTVMGTFTGDGILRVRYDGVIVLDLDTTFLHDGRPQRSMSATLVRAIGDATVPAIDDPAVVLLSLLAHPNIASKERIIRRYDHEIRGTSVVRPLVGIGRDAPADGVVLAEPADVHGIAIGIGVNPWYGELDAGLMAHAVIDEALRNVVAVGADPDKVALMDNFSWGDPRRPATLGALVAAVEACCASSVAHGAPFVSGKDSLNNEYLGSDGLRHSVPPTLVITAVAHVPDANRAVTPDLKVAGNDLVLLGRTLSEFGGSHLSKVTGHVGGSVPSVDPAAPARFRALHQALCSGRIHACHDLSEGGLGVALAEMAIGGRLGVRLDRLPHSDPTVALFSESSSRFVCEIAPGDAAWLADLLGEPVTVLGTVTNGDSLDLAGPTVSLEDALRAFTTEPGSAG